MFRALINDTMEQAKPLLDGAMVSMAPISATVVITSPFDFSVLLNISLLIGSIVSTTYTAFLLKKLISENKDK